MIKTFTNALVGNNVGALESKLVENLNYLIPIVDDFSNNNKIYIFENPSIVVL